MAQDVDSCIHDGIVDALQDALDKAKSRRASVNRKNTAAMVFRTEGVQNANDMLAASSAMRVRLEAAQDAAILVQPAGADIIAPAPAAVQVAAATECVVCMEPIGRRVVFAPCGHQCVCTVCMDQCVEKPCIICRREVLIVVPVYD